MAVQEYIKQAAQNLTQAAVHLRQQDGAESANLNKKTTDLERHINLAKQEITRADLEKTAAEGGKGQMLEIKKNNLEKEVEANSRKISELQQTISKNTSEREAAARQLEQLSHQVESLTRLPGASS